MAKAKSYRVLEVIAHDPSKLRKEPGQKVSERELRKAGQSASDIEHLVRTGAIEPVA